MKINKLNNASKALSYPVKKLAKTEKAPLTEKQQRSKELKKFAMSIAREVGGLAPYELRATELLRRDEDKRCKKFMKKRLGSLKMAKKKIELLAEEMRA
ncbi:60S ribosomal protein L36 [Spraguea lophii 42_110]|uniref:60S ribosomal protein L36 n=1 Tax=Spraguea lophii (strain 42_110) TaxID=1358809 RepID=S7WED1_SPRLO|nr:Chain LII, 60S ribosomal protein L36 [Spraguea lophii 42_110]7QJH_KII Chain KII, 60S ribosomal protein L36 [Spraguea lophii 42_110]7QJH_LII Chain LII, 60S ribosomal protein L36 [Spraguea lophii 42_110]8BR3_LII Chain LII, 60S ribosomal protein L36 [Spraguea lophii 42_110]8P5D_LII Chain LII, 60S ribosomal protein L36 [Spraguea lophii 42_110]8P60_KII Chain KII, 60S ribosomal protein L36 [Spraguea lophii 42_110]8P60_LII Chain LII, 60S ribosomal protein L36 [Spraguea lophii 42_110]EPR80127.1 6